ncbi:MAG: hypothetical protein IJ429_01295 [Lachnospiraceae bacterium]|nr:hypothetical protein [Lachnospiraceae bacterium]
MGENKTQKMAEQFIEMAKEKMGDRLSDFKIVDVQDDPNHRWFSVLFIAYDYYPIRLNYSMGRFGCCIPIGKKGADLDNSQKWWDTADFDVFFDELQIQLELRIPDKFLAAKGWI